MPIKGKSVLTPHDLRLVSLLKIEREKHIAAARSLSDREIAKKFDVSEGTILRVPVIYD